MPTHGTEDCLILQVPVLYGAAIEGSATCLCRIASKTISEFKPRFSTAIDSFISTSLVVAGETISSIVPSLFSFYQSLIHYHFHNILPHAMCN